MDEELAGLSVLETFNVDRLKAPRKWSYMMRMPYKSCGKCGIRLKVKFLYEIQFQF